MKPFVLLALFLVSSILVGCAMAEREHVQVGQFNISFEMNNTHEIKNVEDGIDIRTFDGTVSVIVAEDKSGTSTLDDLLDLLDLGYNRVEKIQVDGKDARMISFISGGYIVLYYPQPGWVTQVYSKLPMIETSDFLKSLHVEPL
jgi:hypothetical protein